MKSLRLVSAAGLALAACLTAPAAAVAQPTHVAIVVDAVGGYGIRVACVPWRSGMSGYDVLEARFSAPPQMTSSGPMVVQIDGYPPTADTDTAKNYWAYFHDTGAGWSYSQVGAASYQPQPGTVEGWRYDAESGAASPPPTISYASICAGADPPAQPRPSPTSASPMVSTTSTQSTAPAAQPPPRTTAQPEASTAKRSRTPAPAAVHRSLANSPAPTTAPDSPMAVSPVARDLTTAPPKASGQSGSAVPPWETVLGIAAVALLGGLAWWRARARHRA